MIMNFSKTQEESLFHRWYLKYGPIFKIRTYGEYFVTKSSIADVYKLGKGNLCKEFITFFP